MISSVRPSTCGGGGPLWTERAAGGEIQGVLIPGLHTRSFFFPSPAAILGRRDLFLEFRGVQMPHA